jgi:sulfite reductase (NADPH) flavoprotein alpha-component
MTISIWRYCHLALALISGLFLVLASLTGSILALEPIGQAVTPFHPEPLDEISVAETLEALDSAYDEVLTLEVDANDLVLAEVVTRYGDAQAVYVHPRTGATLGAPKMQHPFFQVTTNLHRSLFLKGVGRFFVGLASFLLCLIAATGFILIAKRQGGISKLFSRVQKDYFELQYHVVVGRWMLLPIIVVAGTGVYLSAEKFSLLPSKNVRHELVAPATDVDTSVVPWRLEVFQNTTLDQVRSITFPFSDFPEDYFEVSLRDRELQLHQYTGEVLSEQPYALPYLAGEISLKLHTGQGSIAWSLVLLLSGISILFFIYSGFRMWRRRVKRPGARVAPRDSDACEYIILVGSETGTTYGFADALDKALTRAGKSVYTCQINDYTTFKNARHLVFLTATYGEGEAPTNARKVWDLVPACPPENTLLYSVVGFGSLTYPGYCQFARDLDAFLGAQPNFLPGVPLCKINNKSFSAFSDWATRWGRATGISIRLKRPEKKAKKLRPKPFEVIKRTPLNQDDTFIMHLKPLKKIRYQSGDLWEFEPHEGGTPRSYSIARFKDHLVLSIRKHDFGVCSSYLSSVDASVKLEAGIKRNHGFHFPKNAPEIICIGNGTGIAPFLGIIDENDRHIPIELFWGGKTAASLELYQPYLDEAIRNHKLARLHVAWSREGDKKSYVQDLLEQQGQRLIRKLETGAIVMICGSIAMQHEVLAVLEDLAEKILKKPLSDFEHSEQLRMDCY